MLSIVFLEMTSTLCSFSRVSVKYLSVNNHSLLVVLSSKKDVLLGVEGSGQISCKLSHMSAFLGDSSCTLVCSRNVLWVLRISS